MAQSECNKYVESFDNKPYCRYWVIGLGKTHAGQLVCTNAHRLESWDCPYLEDTVIKTPPTRCKHYGPAPSLRCIHQFLCWEIFGETLDCFAFPKTLAVKENNRKLEIA